MAVPKLIRFSTPWQSLLLGLLNYAMLMLLAVTLAYWSWQLFQPSPINAPPAASTPNQDLSSAINAAEWFGESGNDGASTASLDLKLVGIFGALNNPSGKHPGFAIFQMSNGKQLHAMLNQEFTSGLKLTDIGRDSVTVLQNGVPQTISLDEKSKPLEIARIKSSASKGDVRNSDSQERADEKKVRQIKIVGVKPKPAVTPAVAEPTKEKSAEQSAAQAQPVHTTEAIPAKQNSDDMKYLPVEKIEPKPEDKHESLAVVEPKTESKNESQPVAPEEAHTEKKGLLDLLNSVKNWVTGKKQEQEQQQ